MRPHLKTRFRSGSPKPPPPGARSTRARSFLSPSMISTSGPEGLLNNWASGQLHGCQQIRGKNLRPSSKLGRTIKPLTIGKPDTVIRWHRAGFQIVLALEIPTPLRPTNCSVGNSPAEPRDEHCQPVVGSAENPWRASQTQHRDRQTSVAKYMARRRGLPRRGMEDAPSQPCQWHRRDGPLRRADNLVPTALWFADHRLQPAADSVVWVTAHPTAEWLANQRTETCGWEQIPRYSIRDRDRTYGEIFVRRVS